MTDQEKIHEKIKKLLRLSESPNVEEAAVAAGAAQRLMEKYNIERMILDDNRSSEIKPQFDLSIDKGKQLPTWKLRLTQDLAMVNGCSCFVHEIVWGSKKIEQSISLVGTKEDARNVQQLYAYITHQIDRLATSYGASLRRKNLAKSTRTALTSFRLGAVDTVHWRLVEARDAARKEARKSAKKSADSTALVRVDSALARLDARGKEAAKVLDSLATAQEKPRACNVDWNGFLAGQAAGKTLDLGQEKKLKESY